MLKDFRILFNIFTQRIAFEFMREKSQSAEPSTAEYKEMLRDTLSNVSKYIHYKEMLRDTLSNVSRYAIYNAISCM